MLTIAKNLEFTPAPLLERHQIPRYLVPICLRAFSDPAFCAKLHHMDEQTRAILNVPTPKYSSAKGWEIKLPIFLLAVQRRNV